VPADEPEDIPPPRAESSMTWGFAVLALVVVIILIGWGFGGQGGGWGRHNEVAHMMPPLDAGMHGPATRAWTPPNRR